MKEIEMERFEALRTRGHSQWQRLHFSVGLFGSRESILSIMTHYLNG
jgi:hypothetical protein